MDGLQILNIKRELISEINIRNNKLRLKKECITKDLLWVNGIFDHHIWGN